jgi:hypothetical protein
MHRGSIPGLKNSVNYEQSVVYRVSAGIQLSFIDTALCEPPTTNTHGDWVRRY